MYLPVSSKCAAAIPFSSMNMLPGCRAVGTEAAARGGASSCGKRDVSELLDRLSNVERGLHVADAVASAAATRIQSHAAQAVTSAAAATAAAAAVGAPAGIPELRRVVSPVGAEVRPALAGNAAAKAAAATAAARLVSAYCVEQSCRRCAVLD
jgi:hypothetical protein